MPITYYIRARFISHEGLCLHNPRLGCVVNAIASEAHRGRCAMQLQLALSCESTQNKQACSILSSQSLAGDMTEG